MEPSFSEEEVNNAQLEAIFRAHVSKAPETEVGPLTVPTDFQEALEQHPTARSVFERLSSSKKKRFIDVLEQAKEETLRSQLVGRMIEPLQKISQQFQQ